MAIGNAGNQTDCCILASNFSNITGISDCLISANLTAKAEIVKECGTGPDGEVIFGPTIGSLSLTAYANLGSLHKDCQGRAGVSIPWARHQGCAFGIGGLDTGITFIKSGSGSSYVAGNVDGLASIVKSTGRKYPSISISSQSGPSSIGTVIEQTDGAGLIYNGLPSTLSFDSSRDSMIFNFTVSYDGNSISEWYLQNFSLELTPGEIPVANYSFMFYIDD